MLIALRKVGRVVFWFLFVVGAVVLARDLWRWAYPVQLPAEPLPLAASQIPQVCPCESGLICTGPRGGRYCITAAGGKKYL